MTSQEFTALLLLRLKKSWKKTLLVGVAGAVLMVFYSLQKPVTYTATASLFPLNSTTESSTSSMLGALMGVGGNFKSFSNEAAINIIELAQSRATREEVAAMEVPEMNNKTIAGLLLEDFNNHKGLLEKTIKKPQTEQELINWATPVLNQGLHASVNKNNSFVLAYTGRSPQLVRIISYAFIDKISSFYIDLKREKARLDYDFATQKVDSLRSVLANKDKQLIATERSTMFTDPSRMEFKMPEENLLMDKQMIRNQYATAVTNQQDASYVLQKATPVIKVLDKPEPPYQVKSRTPVIFGVAGFIVAIFVALAFIMSGLIIRYLREELGQMMARK